MILIHEAVDRCFYANPDTGEVGMSAEGYEIYEHFETTTVLVFTKSVEEERPLQFAFSHERMRSFVREFEKYRGNEFAIERRTKELVNQCVKECYPDQYVHFYYEHLVEMAALRINMVSFADACRVHVPLVEPVMEMKMVC